MTDSFVRPHRPIKIESSTLETFRLSDMALQLTTEDAYIKSGRTSLSLARGADLTFALTVLRQGSSLKDHIAPGPGIVVVLYGEIDFEANKAGKTTRLQAGQSVVFSAELAHSVLALKDSSFIIIIGGRAESHD